MAQPDQFSVRCPHCKAAVSVLSAQQGKPGVCSACGGRFMVPSRDRQPDASPPAMSSAVPPPMPQPPQPPMPPQSPAPNPQLVTCQQCQQSMQVEPAASDQTLACPACGWQFVLPGRPEVQPPPPQLSPSKVQYVARTNAPGATAALVFGLIGLFCCTPLFVFSIIALANAYTAHRAIALDPLRYEGSGMATAGKVLGIIGLIMGAIWWLAMLG